MSILRALWTVLRLTVTLFRDYPIETVKLVFIRAFDGRDAAQAYLRKTKLEQEIRARTP